MTAAVAVLTVAVAVAVVMALLRAALRMFFTCAAESDGWREAADVARLRTAKLSGWNKRPKMLGPAMLAVLVFLLVQVVPQVVPGCPLKSLCPSSTTGVMSRHESTAVYTSVGVARTAVQREWSFGDRSGI